jgi:hypothetical protein
MDASETLFRMNHNVGWKTWESISEVASND